MTRMPNNETTVRKTLRIEPSINKIYSHIAIEIDESFNYCVNRVLTEYAEAFLLSLVDNGVNPQLFEKLLLDLEEENKLKKVYKEK